MSNVRDLVEKVTSLPEYTAQLSGGLRSPIDLPYWSRQMAAFFPCHPTFDQT
jgi:hypothetical protein